MRIETLLPFGKTDPGLRTAETPLDIRRVAEDAARAEALGFHGLVAEETKDDPFIVLALAAQATNKIALGTAVAIAFPRSPAVTAMSAWTLQKLSGGRFTLGLGTQVKGHIERRFAMTWSAPGPWMRDYIEALRALWNNWQTGARLNVQNDHYTINLQVPLFTPEPIAHPTIPIHLAAVNPYLCRLAGELADGLRPHPVCTPRYIEEVMLPSVRQGAEKACRSLDGFAIAIKPLVATAPTEAALAAKIRDVRARVAFYAATPNYRAAFECNGHGDLARKLSGLAHAKRWEEMPAFVTDDIVEVYATIGTHDEIGEKLKARYGQVATQAEFSIPVWSDADGGCMQRLIAELT